MSLGGGIIPPVDGDPEIAWVTTCRPEPADPSMRPIPSRWGRNRWRIHVDVPGGVVDGVVRGTPEERVAYRRRQLARRRRGRKR